MQEHIRSNGNLAGILKDAGCDEELEQRLVALWEDGKTCEFLRLLAKHKMNLLADLHGVQKRIDCLDFLVYKVKKEVF